MRRERGGGKEGLFVLFLSVLKPRIPSCASHRKEKKIQTKKKKTYQTKKKKVKAGDRVAQLILERIATPQILEVEDLDDTARGAGGYGSTGVKS